MDNLISSSPLPSYRNPPVNEVVCGVRFNTPENLSIPYIGLLWDKFRGKYPRVRHAPPIQTKNQIRVDVVTGVPLPRLWFINERDDQLIQFQIDQFYYNWRRRDTIYPRYNNVIIDFEWVARIVEDFFRDNNFGDLSPTGFELSYVNHIPKKEGWETFDDLPKVFKDFLWNQIPKRFLSNPINISWVANFPLPEGKGTLTVILKNAMRLIDKVPLLVFELKATGEGDSISRKEMRHWFDVAHEMIVRGFADLTTSEIQRSVWGREDE
jgi:uncharacterized protein (TIGR04255 family)